MKLSYYAFLFTLFEWMVSSQGEGLIGSCGTKPGDTFTWWDDAIRPFCLKFSNARTDAEPYTKFYYFGTRVDEYTHVSLLGSNLGESDTASNASETSLWWRSGMNVEVQFEAGNVSTQRMWARKYEGSDTWIFNQLSVVIILEQGIVDEVLFDTGCYACDEGNCIDNNCGINRDDCQGASNKCDFSVYVSWYGTDLNGRYLVSAGQRLSQFQSASAKTYFNYVRDKFNTDALKNDFFPDSDS